MNTVFILLWMIFFHIIDDYVLQASCLSFLKQKSYWQENAPDKLYRYDYIMALIMHSLSWTFMIMLPVAYTMQFIIDLSFVILFIVNTTAHAIIDDMKANRKMINLWQDQLFHIIQILATASLIN